MFQSNFGPAATADLLERAISTESGVPVHLNDLIADNLSDPYLAQNVRRALRCWFMAYLPDKDASKTPFDYQREIYLYEVLDELLSGFIQIAITSEQL